MRTLRRLPAVLAALLLGAHFLRAGNVGLMTVCVVLAVLPFVPWKGAVWIVRLSLIAGAASWVLTTLRIAAARQAANLPYTRMVWILGSVAAFTLLAAMMLPAGSRAPAPRERDLTPDPGSPATPGTDS